MPRRRTPSWALMVPAPRGPADLATAPASRAPWSLHESAVRSRRPGPPPIVAALRWRTPVVLASSSSNAESCRGRVACSSSPERCGSSSGARDPRNADRSVSASCPSFTKGDAMGSNGPLLGARSRPLRGGQADSLRRFVCSPDAALSGASRRRPLRGAQLARAARPNGFDLAKRLGTGASGRCPERLSPGRALWAHGSADAPLPRVWPFAPSERSREELLARSSSSPPNQKITGKLSESGDEPTARAFADERKRRPQPRRRKPLARGRGRAWAEGGAPRRPTPMVADPITSVGLVSKPFAEQGPENPSRGQRTRPRRGSS